LETAKWLLTYGLLEINPNADDDIVFRLCCQYGQLEVAEWLVNLKNINKIRNMVHKKINEIYDRKKQLVKCYIFGRKSVFHRMNMPHTGFIECLSLI
jgi:hypothetical protein